MTIGERIKLVRENGSDKKMSMAAFGEILNVSAAAINQWEKNNNPVPGSIVKLICSQFNVNESWLLTGEGEMKQPPTREQEIASIAAQIYSDPDPFRMNLIQLVTQLDSDQLEALKNIARKIADAANQK